MTGSKKRRKKKSRRFETADVAILGRARVSRAPASSRPSLARLRIPLALVLVLVVAGVLWLSLDDRFYVYHADVEGAVRVSPDDVFRASGLPGIHILWVRPAEVEARILDELPSIESAQVACRLPADCTIAVADRQPRVAWEEDGRLLWIDSDGVIFPAQAQAEETVVGWTVRGPLPRREDDRLDESVHVALVELWASGADVPLSLTYVPDRGLVFTDERGWRVILGQGPGMEERLHVLERLVADLEQRGLTPRFVDVRFADAPYYSLTNEW